MIRRFLVAATAAAGIGLAVVPAAPAQAYSKCPAGTECGWEYFSDAAHTHLQGLHTTNCDGVVLDWGIKAGYSVYVQDTCQNPPNPV
ncbi:DUF6289 family protein [Hamadaea tsunoensis]|uniref:DUF6289 family protein n=1 Tax=Hamadaea tsunoensis TaxID=53368 RepID=UPI00040BBAA9|nr:DUF6289 family protein [Hamadaea tsunoensis]